MQNSRLNNLIPSVSVLVPAYQAQGFISETLNSVSKQVFRDFQVLVSIDKSDDKTELIVNKWSRIHKKIPTRIFRQTHRLGWVKNVNFLLEKCKTKYFMIMPHDDILDKAYLQKMIQCLKDNPQACTVFSDILCFKSKGLLKNKFVRKVYEKIDPPSVIINQDSIRGNQFERILEFLNNYFNALPFRGLVNREVISDFLLLPENDYTTFANDTTWISRMALKGELIRIPEVLYHKRLQDDSVHAQWEIKDRSKLWIEHCIDCLKIIFRQDFTQEEFEQLIESSKSRLLKIVKLDCAKSLVNSNKKERALFVEKFEKRIVALSEAENKLSFQFLQSTKV